MRTYQGFLKMQTYHWPAKHWHSDLSQTCWHARRVALQVWQKSSHKAPCRNAAVSPAQAVQREKCYPTVIPMQGTGGCESNALMLILLRGAFPPPKLHHTLRRPGQWCIAEMGGHFGGCFTISLRSLDNFNARVVKQQQVGNAVKALGGDGPTSLLPLWWTVRPYIVTCRPKASLDMDTALSLSTWLRQFTPRCTSICASSQGVYS